MYMIVYVFFVQDIIYIISMMDVGCSRSFGVFFPVPQELSACYAVSRFLATGNGPMD